MGGRIQTGCNVQKVIPDQDKFQIVYTKNCTDFTISSSKVVHAWNGYGAAKQFLPERLSNAIMPIRGQAVSLKKPGLKINKSLIYYSCPASDEEYMI